MYLHLPYIGSISETFEKRIGNAVAACFGGLTVRTMFESRKLLPIAKKDLLPIHSTNNVIYKFVCHCNQWYVGRTSQRLQTRIIQHVPRKILKETTSDNNQKKTKMQSKNENSGKLITSSAIKEHLIINDECRKNYNDDRFEVITRGRTHFHLSVLEATYIQSLIPSLCRQKQFVYELLLF